MKLLLKIVLTNLLFYSISFGATPVRGRIMGSCFLQWSAAFNILTSSSMAWPITSCPNSGNSNPTCAAGFTLTSWSFVQGNTGSTGGYNDTLDTYWVSYACVKN